MNNDGFSRLEQAIEGVLSEAVNPMTLDELAKRVSAALGGLDIPSPLLASVLRFSPEKYRMIGDNTWVVNKGWRSSSLALRQNPASTASVNGLGIGQTENYRPFEETGEAYGNEFGAEDSTVAPFSSPPTKAWHSLTPSQAFEHIKESVVEYLEAAYRISDPTIFAERGEILRRRGVVAQVPFIEATPAFPTTRKLIDVECDCPQFLPSGLAELVQHGVPVDRFALYEHQEKALLAAFGDKPNLLVATGTGSGKTEAFLLPILADILKEARSWTPVQGPEKRGSFDAKSNMWLHGRRHETRPPAIRAIVLYPMNALVNDQLSRLRRILARGASPDWQRRNLNGNVIHFAMYTSLSRPTGSWADKWRRDKFADYLGKVDREWQELRQDLRDTGNWPRPDSPEMLCRWDMQQAPPDILVTNYSMLEYMLVRPIESGIFDLTRKWLESTPDARLTLVLDEAHTYTGAKGTEVAHLIRRLKERLGLDVGSPKFRGIATSASVPNVPGSEDRLLRFTSDLFGEPADRFTFINVKGLNSDLPKRRPEKTRMDAFVSFHSNFDIQDPMPAIEQLAKDLDLGVVDHTVDPQVALFRVVEKNEDIAWTRSRTARNATLLDQLANECWPGLGTQDERERATAGVLAAGSFARPTETSDTPPLLSTRVHAFFRGVPGIWACMDPNCSEVGDRDNASKPSRPVGKLYTDPRPWCDCGARVLELFSCRRCGLLFLGGIPDNVHQSLWPWSDDLSGERQGLREFQIFGVEQSNRWAQPEHRSTRTTLHSHPNDPYARPVYESTATIVDGKEISPFPAQCPRCQNYRAPGAFGEGREIIEPLRTRGPRSFSVVVENGFRVQPRAVESSAPNFGRKALLFSDSRQEAAALAADLRVDHSNDLFRQLIFRVLHSCSTCDGSGVVEEAGPYIIGKPQEFTRVKCPVCQGSGQVSNPTPVDFNELRRRVLQLELRIKINPTNDDVFDFFAKVENGDPSSIDLAETYFNVALRRELAEDEFSLEPLGLAGWRVRLPKQVGNFAPLTEEETIVFLRSVARLLASENVLLPPNPKKPWEWPQELVPEYERLVLIPGYQRVGRAIPYNLNNRRKLGRYVIAISLALVRDGRLKDETAAEKWRKYLHWPLWKALVGLNILQWAGAKINNQVPYGLRIDSFELVPIGSIVQQCQSCAYVMSEAVLNTCVRCGQETRSIPADSIKNFYRLAALNALPDSIFDDPYPLRSIEHTAQIPGAEARDLERWFQDFFRDDENPDDHRIDVLSVTTTMEMGIDIGSLLCVGLRNVPPTVANYQQRAGRAGRRGSSVATVLSYARPLSHDQYYFQRPPEIVSQPPRVPELYITNDVIARRHVRSLVLQDFFRVFLSGRLSVDLFSSWGTVADFINKQGATALQSYLRANGNGLLARCKKIVDPSFYGFLQRWMDDLVDEIVRVVESRDLKDDLFEALINLGLLPKYAFPVDVVSLSIPSLSYTADNDESADTGGMQRDLKIALAEYAPGAEVIRGTFPQTYIFRSAGVYDPFAKSPDYHPNGVLIECKDCQSVKLIGVNDQCPDQCEECGSFNLQPLPYLRPAGFTVDAALPNAGAEKYKGGGRERSGYVAPARLLVGQTSFSTGKPQAPFAPKLYTQVRVGQLFSCNKGPNRDFPGFIICPVCGRALDEDNLGSHTYPADVPPHRGKNQGPRAGSMCPNTSDFQNQVILGFPFFSEVILLGVDLPSSMDAPFVEPAGKAIWYSFGTLIANAAARVLQLDPGELRVGIRAVRRGPGRIHGEVFLYDDVPGGAGYARAIEQNLKDILEKALELSLDCHNADCPGACYYCLYDYDNQMLHPLLDRQLGAAMLQYVLKGITPSLDTRIVQQATNAFEQFARAMWKVKPGVTIDKRYLPLILEDTTGQQVALWVIHPLLARPTPQERQSILSQHGLRCAVHTSFDLERRPFWVLNHLV